MSDDRRQEELEGKGINEWEIMRTIEDRTDA